MPVIDVSQSSYRALVIAAHRRGMSIDRFIESRFGRDADPQHANETIDADELGAVERSATQVRTRAENPKSNVDAELTETPAGDRTADSSFEALWGRIERNAGIQIYTKRGQGFAYDVEAGYVTVRESGTRVPQSQFRRALAQWPATGPSTMRGVYAASVVWAVLADRRISV